MHDVSIQGKDELKVSRQKKWGLQVLAHSALQENFITTRLWGRESPIQGVVKDPSCVPDNTKDIHTKLVTWADAGKADIILTMGGAGLAAKDKGC